MKDWGRTTFPSHEAVVCLRCGASLAAIEIMAKDQYIRSGDFSKRCSQCNLVTSYDVSPAEAAAIEYEEPDWGERFNAHMSRWERLPKELAEDAAFEVTLKDWRRWHKVTIDGKDKPAPAYDGMLALAKLGIMPPRSLIRDIERTGACFRDQHDDHMWLSLSQRAWRIIAVESRVLFLESFGEQTQVDLARAKWEKYCDKAVEVLNAMVQ